MLKIGDKVIFQVPKIHVDHFKLYDRLGHQVYREWVQHDEEEAQITYDYVSIEMYDIMFEDGYIIKGVLPIYFDDLIKRVAEKKEIITEEQKVRDYFRSKGFTLHAVLCYKSILPHHRITLNGDHNILEKISYCMYQGSDTKPGQIGCVVFYYGGFERKKGKKIVSHDSVEILKYASSKHTTAKEVIEAYVKWVNDSWVTVNTWKIIL